MTHLTTWTSNCCCFPASQTSLLCATCPLRAVWTLAARPGFTGEIHARQEGHFGHGAAAPACQQKLGSDLKGTATKFLNFACFESTRIVTANLDSRYHNGLCSICGRNLRPWRVLLVGTLTSEALPGSMSSPARRVEGRQHWSCPAELSHDFPHTTMLRRSLFYSESTGLKRHYYCVAQPRGPSWRVESATEIAKEMRFLKEGDRGARAATGRSPQAWQ